MYSIFDIDYILLAITLTLGKCESAANVSSLPDIIFIIQWMLCVTQVLLIHLLPENNFTGFVTQVEEVCNTSEYPDVLVAIFTAPEDLNVG